MIKGCQKNIIHIRDTTNKMFEEAYIVLRHDPATSGMSETDMIREAGRIIDESLRSVYPSHRRRPSAAAIRGFLLGALVSTALSSFLLLLIK